MKCIDSLFINTIVALLLGKYFLQKKISSDRWQKIFILLMGSAFLWLLLTAVVYTIAPNYFDHGEVSVASTAAHWLTGHALYAAFDSPERYSLLYGPWPFLTNAFFQYIFYPTGLSIIVASKLPGVVNLLILILLFSFCIKELDLSWEEKFLTIGFLGAALIGFDNASYWDRPDSFLMLFSFMALALIKTDWALNFPLLASIVFGALAGLGTNCKLHGPLYFIPTLVFMLETNQIKKPIRQFLLFSISFTIFLVLPFLVHMVSFENYRFWLELAASQRLSLKLFIGNVTYILFYIFVLYWCGLHARLPKTFYAVIFSFFMIAVVASKTGAGTHHFMALLPVIIYLGAKTYSQLGTGNKKKKALLFGAFFTAILYGGFMSQKAISCFFLTFPQQAKESQELNQLKDKYYEPMMLGYSDINHYESSFYAPLFVAHGGSLLGDGAALMEMTFSGLKIPQSTYDLIESCQIPLIVFPKGKPWTLVSFDGLQLFPKNLSASFFQFYKPIESTLSYTVYKCGKSR